LKWWPQRKKTDSEKGQEKPTLKMELELPYVGANLDSLQKRIAKIIIGLGIVHHNPTIEWVTDVINALRKIQAQAKQSSSDLTRLVGEREKLLLEDKELTGSTYPVIAIISDVVLKNACMLWVPGDDYYYRLIAYYGEGFDDNRIFDGNTLVFDEGLFSGNGHYCCKVDSWGEVDKLRVVPKSPEDPLVINDPNSGWVTDLYSCLQKEVPSKCKVPLVTGNPSDRSTWAWNNEAKGLKTIVLGNLV